MWISMGESIHMHRHIFCSFFFHLRNITRKTRESPILLPAGSQDGSHSCSCTGESFIFFPLEIMALTQLNVSKSSGRQCSQIIYQGTQTCPFRQPSFLANPVDDRKSSLRKERQKTQMAAPFKFPGPLALNFVPRAPTSALIVNCCVF